VAGGFVEASASEILPGLDDLAGRLRWAA